MSKIDGKLKWKSLMEGLSEHGSGKSRLSDFAVLEAALLFEYQIGILQMKEA
jgi:hypothetical protein